MKTDPERGRKVADVLYRAFTTGGIHGRNDMPEDVRPAGVERGSLEHILSITLTVAIDYQREAGALWKSARQTFEDAATRYLIEPENLHGREWGQVRDDMQRYGLSKKVRKGCRIWQTVAITFFKKWGGDPRVFLAHCQWDAPTILERLRTGTHPERGRQVPDYPFLRENKIGPLWVRMLRDNVGLEIENLESVPIPVDVHVARTTLALGWCAGGTMGSLRVFIRRYGAHGGKA